LVLSEDNFLVYSQIHSFNIKSLKH